MSLSLFLYVCLTSLKIFITTNLSKVGHLFPSFGGELPNFNMANEHLKVPKTLLKSSGEMDNVLRITETSLSPVTKIIVMGTNFPSQEF